MCYAFWIILNSGLWITEALGVRVRDIRQVDRIARSVRVIGKRNREPPLPKDFGQVFGFWQRSGGVACRPGRRPDRASGSPVSISGIEPFLYKMTKFSLPPSRVLLQTSSSSWLG